MIALPNTDDDGSTCPGRVLLVEDDDAHAYLIEYFLSIQDAVERVDRVATAEEALVYIDCRLEVDAHALPDLVLLDLNMPGMGGLELVRLIRKKTQRLPLIVLSSSSNEKDIREAYRRGASAYMTKPLDAAAFATMIEVTVRYWLGQQWRLR